MQKSTVQCLSIYPLNEEGIGRIENQMNRYGEGNTGILENAVDMI